MTYTMFTREIVSYLIQRRLVGGDSVVEGDLIVVDSSRRHRNFKVISDRGPCYLLKQGVDPSGIATVAHEAAVYQLLQSDGGRHELNRYLPRFYGYDSEEHILIMEYLQDSQDLREYHASRNRFPPSLAAAMGDALGTLHGAAWMKGRDNEDDSRPTHEPPWILFLHRPVLRVFRDISSANLQVIKIIQRFPEFCELLDGLRLEWRTDAFIHFDIKWDNWIVVPQRSERRKSLKLVDWEFAGTGDPCWDVGSVFMDYLSLWLLSIPITGETPSERFVELARFPLNRMHPAMYAFWQSYVRRMELDTATAHEWLLRATKYAAARLVQTAYEQMQMSMQLTGNVICFLQLSLNILQRPQEAIVHLLGLPLQQTRPP